MEIIKSTVSSDKTKKYFIKVEPVDKKSAGAHIEACLLYLQRHGDIICVSSQLGCSQRCAFCASGVRPFGRNLTAVEIKEQVDLIVADNPKLKSTKFQVTYMGSGEPLANWDSVFKSIHNLRVQYSNLEKVNISTIWPIEALKRYKDVDWEEYKNFLHFQYSLHFPTDAERTKYFRTQLPMISESIQCLEYIAQRTGDTYRINYIPFDGVNDAETDVRQLADVLEKTSHAVLKISQMCRICGSELSPSNRFEKFVESAKRLPYRSECFRSDGTDIHAGCGQFYNDSLI